MVYYPVGTQARGLAIGDFNGDGKLDLVVPGAGNSVSILLGNGDGILDLAVGDFTGDIAVLFGNGDGTFQPPVLWSLGGGSIGPAVVADFNGDGIPDVGAMRAGNGYGSGYFSVLPGNGNGTFQPPVSTTCNTPNLLAPAVGDFNGDGILDVAGTGGEVMLGNGNGTFQEKSDPGGGYLGALVEADFNGDGILDLVNLDSDVIILMGKGDGTFQEPTSYTVNESSLAVGDFNGDGKPDVATGDGCLSTGDPNGAIAIMLNGGKKRKVDAPYCYVLATGDFNGDGKLDLAVVNGPDGYDSGSLSIFLGNGDGTFEAPVIYATGSTPDALVVADFNGDGISDVAVSEYSSNAVSVFLGSANGTLQPQGAFAVGTGPIWIAAADFNGDGKMDLVAANSASSNVSILLGQGNGTFLAQTTIALSAEPNFVAVGDFNGDGFADLAVSYGPFEVPYVISKNAPDLNGEVVGVLLSNGDGKPDIVTGVDVTVLLNTTP